MKGFILVFLLTAILILLQIGSWTMPVCLSVRAFVSAFALIMLIFIFGMAGFWEDKGSE